MYYVENLATSNSSTEN